MGDPIVCNDGYTYERESLLKWFDTLMEDRHELTSPMTGETVDARILPNKVLWYQIDDVIEQRIKIKNGVQLERSTSGGLDHFSKSNVEAVKNQSFVPNLKSSMARWFTKSSDRNGAREK